MLNLNKQTSALPPWVHLPKKPIKTATTRLPKFLCVKFSMYFFGKLPP